jgi:hypothetical protein
VCEERAKKIKTMMLTLHPPARVMPTISLVQRTDR